MFLSFPRGSRSWPVLDFLAPIFSAQHSSYRTNTSATRTHRFASTSTLSQTSRPTPRRESSASTAFSGRHRDQPENDDHSAAVRRAKLAAREAPKKLRAEALRNSPTIVGIRVKPHEDKGTPLRKPLRVRPPPESTDAVAVLSLIRDSIPTPPSIVDSTLPQDDSPTGMRWIRPATSEVLHNDAVRNIKVGVDGKKDYVAAFKRGWRPIRTAGKAHMLPLEDVLLVLETVVVENRRGNSRVIWKEAKDLLLYLAAEPGMPGVAGWCWSDLRKGADGAARVVDLYSAIYRKDHIRLRATDSSGSQPIFSTTKAKQLQQNIPNRLFAAHVAATAIVNSPTESFASILPSLLNPRHPHLARFLHSPLYDSIVTPAIANFSPTEIARVHSWIRQISLAQMWTLRGGKGADIVRHVNLAIRRSDGKSAWEMWLAVKEGFESEEMGWMLNGWETSAGEHMLDDSNTVSFSAGITPTEESPKPIVAESTTAEESPIPDQPTRFIPPPPAVLTEAVVGIFLTAFARAKMFEEANEIWTWLSSRSPPLVPGVVTWTALLSGYATRGDVAAAETVFVDMRTAGIVPDERAYLALASAHFSTNAVDAAMVVAERMFADQELRKGLGKEGFSVDTFAKILAGLLGNGRLDHAEKLLGTMKESGVAPNIYIINLFLKLHTFGSRPDLSAIVKMLRKVEEEGLEADVFTFTMILQALLTVDRTGATTKLLKIMNSTNVKPSVATYGTIIKNLASSGRVAELNAAVELLNEMERTRIPTNEIIYTTLIQGYLRATPTDTMEHSDDDLSPLFDAALTLKDRMQQRGIPMNRIGYNAIISAGLSLQTQAGVKLALSTFDVLRSRKPSTKEEDSTGTADTWYVLLDGFVAMRDYSTARKLLEEMDRVGFKARSKGMRNLVDVVRRGGKFR